MDWDSAVVPLAVAAVGAIAVAIGAWMAARSALRSRMIDLFREDEKERSAFHLRTVRAVGQVTTAVWELIDARIKVLEVAIAGTPLPKGALTSTQDAAASEAVEVWLGILDEAHIFAGGPAHDAMHAFDDKRRDVITAVNAAGALPNKAATVAALKDAQRVTTEMGRVEGLAVYLNLQLERAAQDSKLFYLGHTFSLRCFAKKLDDKRRRDLETLQERIEELKGHASA
ncbi:hypothetical protein [Microbacterium testaceum]|uniref:hypothetical protein n=1 Tax=Microbacterium testaceum TaxID=2033 RepID=UPI0012AC6D7D|nr:hypothetical protein [Microbacterium testaceum]